MAGANLRATGTASTMAPIMKRATGRFSDGKSVAMFIDTNRTDSFDGQDVTGVAKIHLYVSTDSQRVLWPSPGAGTPPAFHTPQISYTPPVAPASNTFRAVAALQVTSDNAVWVAWAGTDGSLNLSKWTYSAGTLTFSATQTVSASSAITQRFRALDLDVAGTSNPIISAYEAKASSGVGSWLRVYIRNNDNTTWRKAYELDLISTRLIYPNTEDVAVSWCLDGIVSNVGKFLVYVSKIATDWDYGDTVSELQYNTSTGTDGSATVRGSWFTNANQNQAPGTRRGWIYKLTSGGAALWMWCGVVGASVPRFFATKLTTGVWSAPIITSVYSTPVISISQFFRMDQSKTPKTHVATSYIDNRLVWTFCAYGLAAPRILREVMFRYNAITDYEAAFVDSNPRAADGYFFWREGPYGVYGSDNSRLTAGTQQVNVLGLYGENKAGVGEANRMRFVAEDVPDAPNTVSPAWPIEAHVNKPNFVVKINPALGFSNIYNKVEVQVATDAAFTLNVRSAIQPNSAFTYYGAVEGRNASERLATVDGTLISAALFQGQWYWRTRLISDKGIVGAWSSGQDFNVVHPPTTVGTSPADRTTMLYPVSGNVTFTWTVTDTEPTDGQTAYYLKVIRADTGVSVVDTGWITSSLKTATVAISGTLKEVPLQWSVATKDQDSVAGAFSSNVQFLLSDAPVIAFTAPTPGLGPLTLNANPTWETNAANWTASGGTVARSTVQAFAGTASGLLTPDGVSASAFIESEKVSIVQGGKVFATNRTWIGSAYAGGISLKVNWYTSGNVFISSTTVGTIATAVSSTWQQTSGYATAPPTAAKASLKVEITGSPAVGNLLYSDESRLQEEYITSAIPVISWSFSGSGSRTQRSYRVTVTDRITSIVVADSGWVLSAVTSHAFTDNFLLNLHGYDLTLQVQDTANLTSSTTLTIDTQWTHPIQPAPVTVTQDGFKATVGWDETDVDIDFLAWRVWRRYQKPALVEMDFDATATTWQLVYESQDPLVDNYRDYRVPLNTTVQYAVTQLVDRFGALVDSDLVSSQTVVVASDRYYFVPENPVGTIASYEAGSVTSDSFTNEVEQETIHVIGRGRQVQVGDDLGYTGSLTIKLRNPASARADREFLEYLSSSATNNVYIRSPFGDVLLVKLGNLSFSRMAGVGIVSAAGQVADMGDLTVPYMVVISNEIPVTRLS